MQKALKWLEARGLPYQFHNYKELGIDKATLSLWLEHFPADKLINTKGTTYRALSDTDKASISDRKGAIALMIQQPSLIKRPVWDLGDGRFYLGWNEAALSQLI